MNGELARDIIDTTVFADGNAESASGKLLFYVYGVIASDQQLPPDVRAMRVEIPQANIAVLVERVAASDFSPEVLSGKLQSLEWVAGMARQHHTVLDRVMLHGPVVPARLCTLFSTAAALQGSIGSHVARLSQLLEELRGRQEWGLKVFCDERALHDVLARDDAGVQALETQISQARAGQAFVLRKQRAARLGELGSAFLDRAYEEILAAIEDTMVAVTTRAPLTTETTGRIETMVLNAAILVDQTHKQMLDELVARLARRTHDAGLFFELSGPWPAFSFCDFADADFSDADFSDADFSDADFSDADFSDADFSDADFSDASSDDEVQA